MPKITLTPPALRSELEDFYYAYSTIIDEKQPNEWVDMFTEEGLYAVTTHNNVAPGAPGMWWFTDRGLLKLKERAAYTNGYHWHNPTRMLHVITNVRGHQGDDGKINAEAAFVMYAADRTDAVQLHVVGRFRDILTRVDGGLKFVEHRAVIEGETVPGNMGVLL